MCCPPLVNICFSSGAESLLVFDLQPEDTQVLVCTVVDYFYLYQICSSLVKWESGIYSSSLPKWSVSLPVLSWPRGSGGSGQARTEALAQVLPVGNVSGADADVV